MNTKRCLDRLMSRMGNRTAPKLRADCLEEMYLAQQRLEKAPELPWFIESEKVTTTTDPLEPRLVLPPDFIREKEDFNLEISPDLAVTWQDLVRQNYDESKVQIELNAAPAMPQHYYIRNGYIILTPAPDIEYFVRWPTYYAKQPEPLDSESDENAWFANVPDLMISMAGLVISTTQLKDPDLMTFYSGMQKTGEDSLVRMMTAKEEENRSRQMG